MESSLLYAGKIVILIYLHKIRLNNLLIGHMMILLCLIVFVNGVF